MSSEEQSTPAPLSGPQAISPAKRRRLQQCFEHGRANVAKGDHDYAVDMFTQTVLGDPGNMVYAQSFLATLHKKYNNNKKGGTLASIKGATARSGLKKALTKKEWENSVKLAVELLKLNPWDAPALLALASVCEEIHADECQLFYLKMALDTNPKDAEINRLAGLALARVGQFDQAIACWHRVEQAKPDNEEARRMIGQLTVDRTIRDGGYGDFGQAGRNETTADEAETDRPRPEHGRAPEQTPEQRLVTAIAKNPEEITLYLDLVDLYSQQDKLEQAEQTLEKALHASGGDLKLRERLEDIQILRRKRQLDVAERRAAKEPSDEAQNLAKRLRAELNQSELEVYAARCDRNPNNDLLRYELGIRLKRAGKFSEAIQNLQRARGDNKRKSMVFLELGECFQYIKQYRLAMNNYSEAITSCGERDGDTLKLALYRAAVLSMGLKEWDTAESHLSTLAGMDFGYKDVAERLDKITHLRNKG